MNTRIILILLCFCGMTASAQENCGSHEIYQEMMKNDPVFRMKQELSKKHSSSNRSQVQGLITIPVVVHIVYNTEAENISDEQIYSQLEVLNEDFNSVITAQAQWSDVAANPEMEFCLASRDIYGNATCGITRTYTDSTEFKIQTSIKDESTGGVSGWPATDYLNVFVCDIPNLRGYATFPDAEDSIDGIVLDYLSFGRGAEFVFDSPRFSLGRTGTHEVGHWLRLSHIWGDGNCDIDDGISDTPSAIGPNFGCLINTAACRGDSVNMVQNYMDYSDDACMNLFTQGQVNLMRKAFDERGSRVSILSSKGCQAPAENEISFSLSFHEFPQDIRWELRNSADDIVKSDGPFAAGDEATNEPPPLANKDTVYTLDIPDGAYTLKLYDSFADEVCVDSEISPCNGFYEIKTIYNNIVVSGPGPGRFIGVLTVPFSVSNTSTKYKFNGNVSSDWYNRKNWNKLNLPDECYDDNITVENNCEVKSLSISQQRNLIIKENATLTVRQ